VRLAVTAAYGSSLHAVALLHELAAGGHDVALALQVGLFSPARLRAYARQLGWGKLSAKVRARLALGRFGPSDEIAPMREYLRARGIRSRTVARACRAVGAQYLRVSSLNAPRALRALREAAVDLVVYAGGGILRRDFIRTPRFGVLNAHGGPLPAFRGMNAGEWSLFYGVQPTVTVHFVDEGVDTGPMLLERPVDVPPGCTVPQLRGIATVVSVRALLEAVEQVAGARAQTTPQPPAAGRQHFVMAEPLVEVLERWLAEGRTPVMAARDFAFPQATA